MRGPHHGGVAADGIAHGLDMATDAEIWAYVGEHGLVIVSKDSDLRQLAFLHGPPSGAIWVWSGNASTIEGYDVLRGHHDAIARFAERPFPDFAAQNPGQRLIAATRDDPVR